MSEIRCCRWSRRFVGYYPKLCPATSGQINRAIHLYAISSFGAMEIGIEKIRAESPLFSGWFGQIENLAGA